MPRMGLNQQAVVDAAVVLIEEKGYENFSMRELAERLHVRTASLYNHVRSMEALRLEVGLRAISGLLQAERDAIAGKERDEALRALAGAYHRYAQAHLSLYKIIMTLRITEDDPLLTAAGVIVEPILCVLDQYALPDGAKLHLQRLLRSVIHGFIAHENSGYFSHAPAQTAESFWFAVQSVLDSIHAQERRELKISGKEG